MKKILLICALIGAGFVDAYALDTLLSTDTGAQMRTKVNGNFSDHETRVSAVESDKADKTAVIRYWSDWPDASPGNTLAIGTNVSYEGDIYKVTQEFVKTPGATPAAFTSYFTKIGGSDYTLPTASADTLGGVKVGDRLTITAEGVLSADVQSGTGAVDSVNSQTGTVVLDADDIDDTSTINKFTNSTEKSTWDAKEDSLGNPSVNGYVLSSTTAGVRSWVEMTGGGTGIAHATADGNYYASKDGGWASLTGLYAPALGADDNYVTDAEKTKIAGIAEGAEVNVNADWNASSGDAQILNKPTIPTVSDAAYDATSWDGSTDAPSKNAIRDKIESMGTGGGTWGSITGTLSAQTDLQNALDLKANSTGISFVAAALSDLKYDPDTGTADDEYNLITNTGSVGDANDATVVPTLERAGALFQAKDANMIAWPSTIDATEVGYLNGLTEPLSTSLAAKQSVSGASYQATASTSTGTGNINIDGVSADHYYFNNGASAATYTPVITSPPASGKERGVILTVGGGAGVCTMNWTNVSFIGTAGASATTPNKYSHYACFIPSSGNAKCKIIAEASDN